MRKTILMAAGLAALLGLAMQSGARIPLNVKTGEWQNHSQITVQGMLGLPPDLAAHLSPEQQAKYAAAMAAAGNASNSHPVDSKGCLTQQDLATDPYAKLNRQNADMQCQGTLLSSTASDIELQEHCTSPKAAAEMDYHLKIHAVDSEHTTGVGDGSATMGGHTMKSHVTMTMTWLGPTCKDDSK